MKDIITLFDPIACVDNKGPITELQQKLISALYRCIAINKSEYTICH